MSQRFCMYHQGFVDDVGFKVIVHTKTGSKRLMCPNCQTLRKRPHKELIALAERDKAERTKK